MSEICQTCRWWQEKPRHKLFPDPRKGLCFNPINDQIAWTIIHNGAVRMALQTIPDFHCGEHQPALPTTRSDNAE